MPPLIHILENSYVIHTKFPGLKEKLKTLSKEVINHQITDLFEALDYIY